MLTLALVLAVAAPAFADGPADEEAIRRAIAAGTITIHPDVMFTNIFGTVFRGRAEWDARHKILLTELFKGMTGIKQTVERIFWVRPDVALVLAETVVTGLKHFPPGPYVSPDGTLRTIGLSVLVKEKGGWVQAAWHNTDVKPPTP
jgi:hypothetical protein